MNWLYCTRNRIYEKEANEVIIITSKIAQELDLLLEELKEELLGRVDKLLQEGQSRKQSTDVGVKYEF